MDKNKLFDKFIMIFLIISPILDFFAYVQKEYIKFPISISLIIRGLFLLIIFIYLIRKQDNRKILLFFLIYFILALGSYLLRKVNIYYEIVNLLKIFYLPIMMLFFSKYTNSKIDDKFILKVYIVYIITFVIMHILKLDTQYIPIISAILVGLLPVTLNYVMESKNYILKVVFYLLLGLITYLIGTRLLVTGFLVVFFGVYVMRYKLEFIYNNFKRRFTIILSFIGFLVVFGIIVRFTPFYGIMKDTITSLNIHSLRDVYRFNTIDQLIFSGGLSQFADIMKDFIKGGYDTIMYGLGWNGVETLTKIDPFDILVTTGIFGSAIFIIMFTYVNFRTELKKEHYYSYVMFLAIAVFAGRTLLYPSVSLFIAVLYLVSANSIKIEKKKYS
ncbi:MAG: O-antigen ligase family protein [Bacilli bacterium]|nr:O-antigen ligase family protein [Bacilli bacterium]